MAVTAAELQVRFSSQGAAQVKSDIAGVGDAVEATSARSQAATAGAGLAMGALGTGLLDFTKSMTEAGASYQQEMQFINSLAGGTQQTAQMLQDEALKLDRTTVFSAQDIAAGMEQLAREGFTPLQIAGTNAFNSLIQNASNMAAALRISMPDAANMLGMTMRAYQEDVSQTAHVTDILTEAALRSGKSASEFNTQLSYVEATAHNLGIPLEDISAATGELMAQNVPNAGYGLRAFLVGISTEGSKANKELTALGISAYDAQGNFIGLGPLIDQINTALSKLSPEEQSKAITALSGGNRSVTALIDLLRGGSQGLTDFEQKMGTLGGAAHVMSTLMDNAAGSFKAFASSLETAKILMGESIAPLFRPVTDGLRELLGAFIAGPNALHAFAAAGIAVTGALFALTGAVAIFKALDMGVVFGEMFGGLVAAAPLLLAVAAGGALFYETWQHNFLGIHSLITGLITDAEKFGAAFHKAFSVDLLRTDPISATLAAISSGFAALNMQGISLWFDHLSVATHGLYLQFSALAQQVMPSLNAAWREFGLANDHLVTAVQDLLAGDVPGALRQWRAALLEVNFAWDDIGTAVDKVARSLIAMGGNTTSFLIPVLNWAEFIPTLAWDGFITILDWAKFLTPIAWDGFLTVLDWARFLTPIAWDGFIEFLNWGAFLVPIAWDGFITVLDWAEFLTPIAWGGFIDFLNWGAFLVPIAWGGFITLLDWAEFLTPIAWGTFIDFLDWGAFLVPIAWDGFVSVLSWAEFVTPLVWSDFVSSLSWAAMVAPLAWDVFVETLSWAAMVTPLAWDVFIDTLDWAIYVAKITWSTFITALDWVIFVDKLVWSAYVTAFDWATYIAKLDWKLYITPIEWGAWVVKMDWNLFVKALDWSLYVAKLVWPSAQDILAAIRDAVTGQGLSTTSAATNANAPGLYNAQQEAAGKPGQVGEGIIAAQRPTNTPAGILSIWGQTESQQVANAQDQLRSLDTQYQQTTGDMIGLARRAKMATTDWLNGLVGATQQGKTQQQELALALNDSSIAADNSDASMRQLLAAQQAAAAGTHGFTASLLSAVAGIGSFAASAVTSAASTVILQTQLHATAAAAAALAAVKAVVTITGDNKAALASIDAATAALGAANGLSATDFVLGDNSNALGSIGEAVGTLAAANGLTATDFMLGDNSNALSSIGEALGTLFAANGTTATTYIDCVDSVPAEVGAAAAALASIAGTTVTTYVNTVSTGVGPTAAQGGIVGNLPVSRYPLAGIRGFADGGLTGGSVVLVGEQGPELAYFPNGTYIQPHGASMNALRTGVGGVTIQIGQITVVQQPGQDGEALAIEIMQTIARAASTHRRGLGVSA